MKLKNKPTNRKKSSQKRQSGQALVEYVLLLSIVVTLSLTFLNTFNRILGEGITRFNAVFESELRTGNSNLVREYLRIWEN